MDKKVFIVLQESNVDGEILINVTPCNSHETALEVMNEKITEINTNSHFADCDKDCVQIQKTCDSYFTYDENDDYYEKIDVFEKDVETRNYAKALCYSAIDDETSVLIIINDLSKKGVKELIRKEIVKRLPYLFSEESKHLDIYDFNNLIEKLSIGVASSWKGYDFYFEDCPTI